MPPSANVMKGRFVLSEKGAATNQLMKKAQFVVQAFREQDKSLHIHSSWTARAASIRLLGALSCAFGMRLWAFEVTHAYLQSDTELAHELSIEPRKSLG